MVSRLKTSAVSGLDAQAIDVEVYTRLGQSKFTIIGLADSAVKEARDRVTQAIRHLGFRVPNIVLVNLAPAEIRKEGASFDLAIAIGTLAASNQIELEGTEDLFFFGELSLDGRIKPLRGTLALVISALQAGAKRVIVPLENFQEASLVKGLDILAFDNLTSVIKYLTHGERDLEINLSLKQAQQLPKKYISDVCGQTQAKRALLIAAAGGHNLLMIGPPGCGKSMLASRFSNLLPPLSEEEGIEVVKIHSVAGLPIDHYLNGGRPFRNPHHVVSDVGLIGGGSYPKPGEISLAHYGVLFLDEFPEFRRSALESLRAPLENGSVQITRAKASFVFPADFQLIAAMNPCPCGRLGSPSMKCTCPRTAIEAYLKKLSEPILDRIDLHTELDAVTFSDMTFADKEASNDDHLIATVLEVRNKQLERRGKLNVKLELQEINKSVKIEPAALNLIEKASAQVSLSARSMIRVLRVALTISQIENSDQIMSSHVAEALSFRKLERLRQYAA